MTAKYCKYTSGTLPCSKYLPACVQMSTAVLLSRSSLTVHGPQFLIYQSAKFLAPVAVVAMYKSFDFQSRPWVSGFRSFTVCGPLSNTTARNLA